MVPEAVRRQPRHARKHVGLLGVAELIQGLVPLFVRVDPGDVRVSAEHRHPHFERPTITVYDCVPGGVGLSERIYRRLMLCFSEIGRPTDAIDTYNRCRKTLESRLSVSPSSDTRKIYDKLVSRD